MLMLVKWACVLTGVAAALLGLRAATVHVRDSIDQMIGDIHRQSRWAAWSAAATAATALLLVAQTLIEP